MNVELLRAIANASAANTVVYVGPTDGKPLADAGLISVDINNRDPNDNNKVAASITDAGVKHLASLGHQGTSGRSTAMFAVQSGGLELPKIKRGGNFGAGAPTKYPFETMNVGDFFFVANTAVEKGDVVKTLSSAAGSANQRYSEDVVENGQVKMKTVTRAKRGEGNKALKDAEGKVIKETVTIPEKRQTRHFVVRPVKAGVKYGTFEAPADGAVVVRMALKPDTAQAA